MINFGKNYGSWINPGAVVGCEPLPYVTTLIIFQVCRLYEGDDHDDPVAVLEKEVRIKKPFTFKFSDLKPDTKYTAMVNGICKYNVIHRTARYNMND